MNELYTYRAIVVHIVDGDTIDLHVDLGFHIYHRIRVRLIGIDTPEIYGPNAKYEKEQGILFKEYLQKNLLGKSVIVKTQKDRTEKYGRYLAEIYVDGVALTEMLKQFAKEKGIDITYQE